MTTATATRPAPPATGGALAGTWQLVRFQLRRDRVKLPAWVGGFMLFVAYLATALPVAYGTDEDLAAATQLFGDPVARMLIGPGYGFDDPTIERFVANGYGLYFLLLAALMAILLVTRHTRVEEQTGRAELVRANVVGRHAALTATLIVAAITGLAAGLGVFVMMVGVGGFAAGGSLLFGAGVAVLALAFAGVAATTVQLTEYSRAAAGMAGAVLGLAFLLRAGGDTAELGGSWLSWLSPLGWGQQTAPFVLDRWWPLLLVLVFGVVWAVLGFALSARRDVGASMLAVRPGRARAAASLGTPLGLALRLQRGSIIGWGVALVIGGVAFGAYTDAVVGALDDLPAAFQELFGDADDFTAGFLAYMVTFMTYLVASFATLAMQGLRSEETGGRGEPVLATPVSRWSWLGSHLVVTAGAAAVLLAVTGFATGLGATLVTGDAHHLWEVTVAQLNQLPAVLVVLAVAALLFGALPRAIALTWVLVGYSFFAGTFGPLMDLPQPAANLSPFEHAAEMPLEPFTLAPLLILTVIAAGAATLGLVTFRRRGINVT